MARPSKHYTESFKKQVLAEWASGDRVVDIAERHGVQKSSLYKWRSEMGTGKRGPVLHEDSQVKLLKAKLRQALFAQYKAETGIDLSEV